jgi:microcystin-dependent protein
MTTYLDYKTNPAENTMAPPVGAPENLPTNQVNNIQREMMSVIRQLGDQTEADILALGTMSEQDADAVAITGGTVDAAHAGSGAGLTALPVAQLTGDGLIPAAVFPPEATPLAIKVGKATVADTLTATGALALLPIGTVIMWWGADTAVPAGWHICDGTVGTPNLLGKFPICAGAGVALGQQGGQYAANIATDAQGTHSHAGGTAGAVLTEAQMPSHVHGLVSGYISGTPQAGAGRIWNGNENFLTAVPWASTDARGGGQAHTHAIGADGNHAHNVNGIPTVPPYTALWFIMRVS